MTTDYPLIQVRLPELLVWGPVHNDEKLAMLRFMAADYVSGSKSGGRPEHLQTLIDLVPIKSIVIKESVYQKGAETILKSRGYQEALKTGEFILLLRI